MHSGDWEQIIAVYNEKHCTQVAKSGMRRFCCSKSWALTRRTPPSGGCMGLTFPFAGGSSARSMNSPARIRSASFFETGGRPWPTMCWEDILPAVDGAPADRVKMLLNNVNWAMLWEVVWMSGGVGGSKFTVGGMSCGEGNAPSGWPIGILGGEFGGELGGRRLHEMLYFLNVTSVWGGKHHD